MSMGIIKLPLLDTFPEGLQKKFYWLIMRLIIFDIILSLHEQVWPEYLSKTKYNKMILKINSVFINVRGTFEANWGVPG
jgi:hypothetical protein